MKITKIDFNIEENHKDHHTSEFQDENFLIVRRAQKFVIQVSTSRKCEQGETLTLDFKTGKHPVEILGTHIVLQIDGGSAVGKRAHGWKVNMEKKEESGWFNDSNGVVYQIEIVTANDAIVGFYEMEASHVFKGDSMVTKFDTDGGPTLKHNSISIKIVLILAKKT